jgi:PAS domain S-box-containing protein
MQSESGRTGALLDAIPTGVAVVDPESGRIRDANDAIAEQLGCDPETLLGRPLGELTAEGWIPESPIEEQLAAVRDGEELEVEWQCRRWDGDGTQWVEATLSPFESEGRTEVAVTVDDVTTNAVRTAIESEDGDAGSPGGSSERAEENDRTTPLTEAELQAVYHSVNESIYVHDADGNVVDVNRTAAESNGYSREAFRQNGLTIKSSGNPPYTHENAAERIARAAAGETQTFEWQGEDSDGNVFWEEVSLTRTAVGGEVRVLAIVRDVDERKRYEQELEYREALLEAQAEASIDGHLVVDGEGNVLSYNSRFEEQWDVPTEILESRDSERLLEYVLGEVADPAAFVETIEYIYDNRRTETRDEIRHEDGRWFDRYSAPVVGDDELYGRLWLFRDVTESKERERELTERNDRLRALFANSAAAIIEYVYEDGSPVIEDVNERFEDVFGYDAESVVGRSLDECIVPPEDEDRARELNAKVERGEDLSTEVQRRTADGVRTFLLRNAPIDTENETRGYASYTDVTERKEREREIEEQRQKYSTLVERSHDGVVIVQDEEFKFVNRAMAELTGRSKEDLLGTPFYDVIAPEYRDLVRERYRNRLAGESPPENYDLELLTADGECRTADVGVSRIQYQGGPATLATFNDVTEREAQRERFQAFIENSTDVISVLDEDGTCRYQSPSSERVLGYEQDELIGENLLEYVHPEDRERVRERFGEAVGDAEATPVVEYRFEHGDGSWRWLESVGNDQLDNPTVEGIVINSRDVTERRAFERRLAEKNEKLELLNRIVRHDIRNDMSVASAEAEMLVDGLDEDQRVHLDSIVESIDHVVELTDVVRDLMRTMLEDENSIEPTRLDRVLDDELEVVRRREDVTVDAPEPLPEVSVEADGMLGAVFRNLLTNAVRHNDSAEPTVSVSVSTTEDHAVVRVADDGRGVPDDRKEEVFGRGEKGLQSPGSGVGLYLVDTLVEGYGGEVWVEDREEPFDDGNGTEGDEPSGAVFVVRLRRSRETGNEYTGTRE